MFRTLRRGCDFNELITLYKVAMYPATLACRHFGSSLSLNHDVLTVRCGNTGKVRACCRSLGTFVLRTLRGCRTGAQEHSAAAQQEQLQVQATALPSPLSQLSGQPEQEGIQVQKFDRHSESEVISRRARSEAPAT